jgi:hypothetical protein
MAVTDNKANETGQPVDPTTGGVVTETPQDPAAFQQGVIDAPGEEQQQQQQQGQGQQTFTAEDIARARREEKDKLYPRIEETQARLARLEQEREEERQRAQAEADRVAQEAEQARLAELSALERIEETERRFNERLAQIEEERAQERALAEKEQELLRVQQYIAQQQQANAEDIVPELLDLIAGNTKEEVDASVATLRERSASILQNVAAAQGDQPSATAPRGASITAPPVGPSDTNSAQRTFTADEIAAMSVTEYAKHRETLMQGASQRVRDRGLYD